MTTHYKYEEIIRRTILQEMILAAEAANMPRGFIENIRLTKVSETQYEIENDWHKDDKYGHHPLAKFFEYGTDDHWIAPVNAAVLAWPSGGPESGQPRAIYSKRADNKKGNMLFSKGHYVTGLPALEPMHRGFRIGRARMTAEVQHAR